MKKIVLLFITLLATLQAYAYDVTVAADGSGNFTTVQAAITAAPNGATTPYTIFIKKGTYKEIISVPSTKTFLTLVGESVADVILTYDNYSGKAIPSGGTYGTSNSATVTISANNFTAVNITFENTTGEALQALAINVAGDMCAFKNCRFLGGQDTLLANGDGKRQYFKQCYIDGTVDFIFGSSIAIFDDCTIYPKTRSSAGNSYITAANTPTGTTFGTYGYVFRNCEIKMNRGTTTYFLGRPWQNDAATAVGSKKSNKVVWLNTIQRSTIINATGWSTWDAGTDVSLITYAENNSTTDGTTPVVITSRVAWSQQLDATQAATYTTANIFGSWDPCTAFAGVVGNTGCTTDPLPLAISNFKGVKGTTTAAFTWNASFGIAGVQYDLFRSIDNKASFQSIYSTTSTDAIDVNFGTTDANPPSGSTYYYYVQATAAGLATDTSGIVPISSTQTITVGTLGSFLQGLPNPSNAQSYSLSAVNLTGDLTITPPANYQISLDNGVTWSSTPLSITPVSGTIASRSVAVRLNSTVVGTFSGNIVNSSPSAVDGNVAVTGTVQATPLETIINLLNFPLTGSNDISTAILAAGVSTATPVFSRLVLSNGTTVATIPAYSTKYGQAFGADATGLWTTAVGGPGGNMTRTIYEQFTITATTGYALRVDTITLNAGVYNTTSNIKLAVVYSKTGFTTADSTNVTGGIVGTVGGTYAPLASPQTGGFESTPVALPIVLTNTSSTNGTTVNYRLALNSTTGVTLAAGQTLTVRLYFTCSSGSAGRYGSLMNVNFRGLSTASLPLSMRAFSGENIGNQTNQLKWETASESNNAAFEIQRSTDAVNFQIIGNQKGAGTTTTPQYYTFLDVNPANGVNYYRLRQIDTDGKSTFSKTIAVNNATGVNKHLKAYPSVCSDILTIETEAETVGQLTITDAIGKTVWTNDDVAKGFSTLDVNTSRLPVGIYFIQFKTKAGGQLLTRFVKE